MKLNLIIKNIFFSCLTIFIFFEIIFFFLPVREPANTVMQTKNSIIKLQPNYSYTYSSGPFFQITSQKKTNNFGYNSNYNYELNQADLLIIGDKDKSQS